MKQISGPTSPTDSSGAFDYSRRSERRQAISLAVKARPYFQAARWFARWAFPAICLAGGYIAHLNGRPVTAAMAFLMGVVLIGLQGGVRVGLLAGLTVSAAYNFLLSEPTLRFVVTSLEDAVPLIAFNVSAVASAYLTGRLRDEASASALARERLTTTLALSEELQSAVEPKLILEAILKHSSGVIKLEVSLDDGRSIFAGTAPDRSLQGLVKLTEGFTGGSLLAVVAGDVGPSLETQLKLAALALERWALSERLTGADVIRQSEAFKTALLSSLSHDLRTPLSVISASAGTLRHLNNNIGVESRAELLGVIEEQVRRLDRLTGELLSLGRIEGGLKLAHMPTVDLVEVLGGALQQVREGHQSRAVEKHYELDEALVRADPALLEQALSNVIQNAIVHTPSQSTIRIHTLRQGDTCLVRIIDEGPGVMPSQREVIFERFAQVSDHRSGRGSGLGLAIARGFIRAIGGDLAVLDREDGTPGSVFEFRVPMLIENERPDGSITPC